MSNDLDAPPAHPIGTITMWSGFLEDIPGGWFICDGLNGTPNLIARFLRGSPDATDPGSTGGGDTHILLEGEMDQHTHSLTDPTHTHDMGSPDGTGSTITGTSQGDSEINDITPGPMASAITVDNTGSDNSHESRPAYFEMAFIQKVN